MCGQAHAAAAVEQPVVDNRRTHAGIVARAFLPAHPDKAQVFLNRAVAATVDPRLRPMVSSALTMIEAGNIAAALRWIDRALNYDQARRGG